MFKTIKEKPALTIIIVLISVFVLLIISFGLFIIVEKTDTDQSTKETTQYEQDNNIQQDTEDSDQQIEESIEIDPQTSQYEQDNNIQQDTEDSDRQIEERIDIDPQINYSDIELKLVGVCELNGSADQYDLFVKNPCKIINTKTNDIIITITNSAASNNIIKINSYTSIFLLNKENATQYIATAGGEGGDAWGAVYSLDLSTNQINLLDKYLFSSDGMGESHYGDTNLFIDVYNGKQNCEGTGYECSLELVFKNSNECIGNLNPFKYVPECFENWNDLSDEAKTSQLSEFERIKNSLLVRYNMEQKYMIVFNSLLDLRKETDECNFPNYYNDECSFTLKRVDSNECKDPFNKKAYSESCLIGWEKLSKTQKDYFNSFPERYTELFGSSFMSDYYNSH